MMNGAATPERSSSASPPPPTQAPSPVPSPTQPLEWRFSQVFGERSAGEEVQDGTIDPFDSSHVPCSGSLLAGDC